ncbi:MAG: hypothetical protein COU35_04925 [Candidatus Magasanikbacteria bacterium CG10_big_fil_rev_8_21_14_0_10_47_10]|uniref:Glycosyltransferase subfamily 4-like N-terminal domain-containing protein n=1 Tax=Candidatus Magasanikbacteria bacterium CG10_big_fil_rev_8_21_14_0_10_47_10 TaxID=1974652 RepID=A0A2H0TP82_9BACT|nr:MAG: hypothetical protein COU35_04925 [Candidatus Magasanikbacteria bacterium CG10_big_fil_rev_8_21_14_0_10_47_10]
MKICLINNIYPPYHRGGAEQVVVKTVEGLVAAGHDVVVITSTPDSAGVTRESGATIYRIRVPNIFFYTNAHEHGFLTRFLWHVIDIANLSCSHTIRTILNTERPDIVHTHNLMGLSFLIPRTIQNMKIRHIHTVHDVQLVEPSGIIYKEKETSWRYTGFPTKIYTWLMKHLMGSPQVVISPSQFLKNFYSSRGFFPSSHLAIVRNPMTFHPAASHAREAHSTVRFLYIGQLEKHKGVETLIEAFRAIPTSSAELHIVGGGAALESIRTAANDMYDMHVHGRVEREDLPRLFSRMDMTVVPSLCYENSPTVIFESLAFGLPVIASNIEGVAELIQEGENGLTFPAGDAAALASVMLWCVAHTDAVVAMQQKTNQSLIGLSRDEYIGRLEEFYQNNYK